MNKVTAIVKAIEKTNIVTYIHVKSGDTTIKLIKSRCPEWVDVGDKVYCSFREASVCVSKKCPGKVSIENRLPSTLKSVRKSGSLCELTFDSDMGDIVSLITADAYDDLELYEGCSATMLLRGIDIKLEPCIESIDIDKIFTMGTKVAN